MYTKNEALKKAAAERGILIAAHRGTNGGNIIQNTSLAYRNALLHGADMIEVDAIMSTDGIFYAFHNGEEQFVFGIGQDIRTMSSAEIEAMDMMNPMMHPAGQKIERLDRVLERFRGKCLINIDRSWFYWKEAIEFLDGMDMGDQILLKSAPERELLKVLEESRSSVMYMPIMKTMEDWDIVKEYDVNVAAAELIFEDLDHPFLKPGFMAELKGLGILPWVNAITLDSIIVLSGGLDDNRAVGGGFEESWGRLADLGFEIIQTDWPALLKGFLEQRQGRRRR